MAVYARKQYIHVCSEDTSRRLGRRTPGSVGREVWVPNASNCWMRDILSVSSSRISTNCPDLILSTSFLGKGSDAGNRLNPARDVLGSRPCEVVVAATASPCMAHIADIQQLEEANTQRVWRWHATPHAIPISFHRPGQPTPGCGSGLCCADA